MMQKTTTRNSKIQTKRFQTSSTTNLSVKKISNQKSTPAIIIKGKKNVSTTKLALRKTNLEMKKFSAKINNSSKPTKITRPNKLNKNVNIKNFRPIKCRLITTTTKHSAKHDLKLIKYKFVENSFVVNNDDNDDDFDFDDNDFLRSTLDSSSSSSSSWSIGTNETTTETKSKTLSIILSLNNHNNNNPLTTKRWSSKEINNSSSSIIEVFGYLNLEQFCAELEGLTNL